MSVQSRTSVIVSPNKGIQIANNYNPLINKHENIPLPLIDSKTSNNQDYRVDYPHGAISLFKLVPPFTSQNKNKEKTRSNFSSQSSTHSPYASTSSYYATNDAFVPSAKLPSRRPSMRKRLRPTQNAPLNAFETRHDGPNQVQNSKKVINISQKVAFTHQNRTAVPEFSTVFPDYEFWGYHQKRYEKFSPTLSSEKITAKEKGEIESTFFVRNSPDEGYIRPMASSHWILMPVQGWFALSIIFFVLLILVIVFCAFLYKSWRKKQKLILKLLTSHDYIIKPNIGNQNSVVLTATNHSMASRTLPLPTVSGTSYMISMPRMQQQATLSEQEDSSVYEENENFH